MKYGRTSHFLNFCGEHLSVDNLTQAVFIFWFGTMVMAAGSFQLAGRELFTYFASVVITVIVVDIIKVLSSTQLRRIINDIIMSRLFRVTGLVLMVFGVFLIVKAITS